MSADAGAALPDGVQDDASSLGNSPHPAPRAVPGSAAPDLQAPGSSWRQIYAPPVLALGAFVLVCLSLAFLSVAAPILNPVLLGGFLAALALPGFRLLNRRKIKSGLAMATLFLSMLVLGAGIALLVWLSATRLMDGLAAYSTSISARIEAWGAQLAALGVQPGAGIVGGTAGAANSALRIIVRSIVSAASQFLIAAVLAAFLLLEARRIRSLLGTSMRDLPYIGMLPQVVHAAVQYFLIRIRLNLLTGFAFGLLLWLLGVDYALLWGVLTVLLSFVPYIGLVLAATPATLLALAEFGAGRAIVVVVGVVIINTAIENVLAPSYTGKVLSLSPAVVFISFLFWVWLLGPVGALLAMPITVLLMLTFGQYEPTRWMAQLMGGGEPAVP